MTIKGTTIMVLGGMGSMVDIGNNNDYYHKVLGNIQELRSVYPFTTFTSLPTVQIQPITIHVIAADNNLIQKTCAKREDFVQEYSKELEVVVPFEYETVGCEVYGGSWIDLDKTPLEYQHFHKRLSDGRLSFCVGVPESFRKMHNVILECVRTADRMMKAYELFQSGQTKNLELISYAHGQEGIDEYRGKKKKYQSK